MGHHPSQVSEREKAGIGASYTTDINDGVDKEETIVWDSILSENN